MTAWIRGVGTSNFGKQGNLTVFELAWQAIREAFEDCGDGDAPHRPGIDAIYVGNVFGEPGIAKRAVSAFGLGGQPILTLESACASGTSAFHEAAVAVSSGRYRNVLVLGLEQMTSVFSGAIIPQQSDPEGRTGLAMPGLYALCASRWLYEGRVTLEQMAAVSVKNHAHAQHNPRAQYRGSYTIDEVLSSPMIADPLTLLQCCPISDGAAALVVSGEKLGARDVRVLASAQRSGGLWDYRSEDVWGYSTVRATALEAYEIAGLGPADVSVAEVHDAFTIGELETTEATGLAPEGSAGAYAAAGVTALGGRIPINPSGGLLSRGHPLGATGVAQLAEIVWQLRGAANGRQAPNARIGLVETMGGGVAGVDGNACVVALLEEPSGRGREDV